MKPQTEADKFYFSAVHATLMYCRKLKAKYPFKYYEQYFPSLSSTSQTISVNFLVRFSRE